MGRKRRAQQPKIQSPHLGEPQLPGWPGFRTRGGRSGLDPLDTYAEVGHAEGLFVKRLITLRLRTQNSYYLAAMATLGGGLFALSSFFLFATVADWADLSFGTNATRLLIFLPLFLISLLVVANLLANLAVRARGRGHERHKGSDHV